LKIYRHKSRYRPTATFKTFIYVVARSVLLNKLPAIRRTRASVLDDALLEKAWRESATDFAAAQADALKAENALVAASPAVFLYDEEAAFVLPDDLRGFRYNLNAPRVPFFFYDLRLGP